MKEAKKNRKKQSLKKKELLLSELKKLYEKMENSYNEIANKIGLTCDGCEDNCCVSYFQHHTHIEWAYLFRGILNLPESKKEEVLNRAREYVEETQKALVFGEKPRIMCPLNEDGRCILYDYRLMICRLHGVPNFIKMPDGRIHKFSGCFKAVNLIKDVPLELFMMDRTPFYIELATLEKRFKKLLKNPHKKVDFTLAQMLILGEPK